MWAKTGIASMRDAGLAELPEELCAVAHSIRVSLHPLRLSAAQHMSAICMSPSAVGAASCQWSGCCIQMSCWSEKLRGISVPADGGCELQQTANIASKTGVFAEYDSLESQSQSLGAGQCSLDGSWIPDYSHKAYAGP